MTDRKHRKDVLRQTNGGRSPAIVDTVFTVILHSVSAYLLSFLITAESSDL